ncbi:MAG: MarR family winged helix-turn-helix transcriptional regulator [Lachnospiraceae bacterium]|nr:MarR family winged helix-turn-helix transcriptional regulator [Lachnospiraceae bacterium]
MCAELNGNKPENMKRNKDNDVGIAISVASNLIKREINRKFEMQGEDALTGKQNAVLGYLLNEAENKDVFQKDIEKLFEIRGSSATTMMQILEDKGYIRREPVEYDARLKRIVPTKKAEDEQKEVRKLLDSFSDDLKEGISDEDLKVFFKVMGIIKDNLKKGKR